MAKKPETRFTLFDVLYEDGTLRSNCKIPTEILGGLDGDDPARNFIEAKEREISEKSGQVRRQVKMIRRAGERWPGERRKPHRKEMAAG